MPVIKRLLQFISVNLGLLGLLWLYTPALAQAATTLTVEPATQTIAVGSPAVVTVKVNSVTNLGAYQFTLNFDPSVLHASTAVDTGFITSTGRTGIPLGPTINNTLGTIVMSEGSMGAPAAPSGTATLATITFSTLKAGSPGLTLTDTSLTEPDATIIPATVSPATITVQDFTPTPTPTVPVISPTPTITPTPTVTGAPSPTPTLGTTPSPTPSVPSGTTLSFLETDPLVTNKPFTVDLLFSTSTSVSGVDALVTFDPAKLSVQSISDNHLLPVTPLSDFNNSSGVVRVSQVINPGTGFTGVGSLVSITFVPKSTGDTTLTFQFTPVSKADTNAISFADGKDILDQPLPLVLSVQNPADLQLTLDTPSDKGYQVHGQLTVQGSTFSADMTTDASGSSNIVRLDNTFVGALKTFFYKVSGFLRKSFNLTAIPGLNHVDLGMLKAGDLNDDGTINTVDLSLLYGQWFNAGNADFNQDGVVNSADHWILIQNYLQSDE